MGAFGLYLYVISFFVLVSIALAIYIADKKIVKERQEEDELESLTVRYNTYLITLNKDLILEKGLSNSIVDELLAVHLAKFKVFEEMDNAPESTLYALALRIEMLEFKLQRLWGFSEDDAYHKWREVPRCDCPYLDNLDYYDHKLRNYHMGCPVHGKIASRMVQ